jgi:NAD(P)H-nitrite reductase large subunit
MNSKVKLTPDEIKLRLRAVCICKGIKMGRICDAIQGGCKTVEDVNKSTGSGNGGCGATRCRPVIEQLLQNGGIPLANTPVPQDDDDDLLPY